MLFRTIHKFLVIFFLNIASPANAINPEFLGPNSCLHKNGNGMEMVGKPRIKPAHSVLSIRACFAPPDSFNNTCKAICSEGCPKNAMRKLSQKCVCEIDYTAIYWNNTLHYEQQPVQKVSSTTEDFDNNFEGTTQYDGRDEFVEELSSSLKPVTRFPKQLKNDCQRNQCPAYAICLANGTCICLPDYESTNEPTSMQEVFCLPLNKSWLDNTLNCLLIMLSLGVALAILLLVVIELLIYIYSKRNPTVTRV